MHILSFTKLAQSHNQLSPSHIPHPLVPPPLPPTHTKLNNLREKPRVCTTFLLYEVWVRTAPQVPRKGIHAFPSLKSMGPHGPTNASVCSQNLTFVN